MTLEERITNARLSPDEMEALLKDYTPFIKATISKTLKKYITTEDESLTTGMMGFHEAVMKYNPDRGGFLNYAQIIIRNRIIDDLRIEKNQVKHIELGLENEDHENTIAHIQDDYAVRYYENRKIEDRRKDDLTIYMEVLKSWGLTMQDLVAASPKKKALLEIYQKIGRSIGEDEHLLSEMRRTRRLPVSYLIDAFKIDKKRLERGRKYIIAVAELWAGDFETLKAYVEGR
jgi:RNA polymerase sigma factor